MKRVWVAMLMCTTLGSSWAMSIADIKKAMPELADMNNKQVVDYLHERYYSDMDKSVLAARIGVKLADPLPPKPRLGPIDQWRFESCQKEAAQAPTVLGVSTGLRLCREKFGQ